jgi:hypothetical protein
VLADAAGNGSTQELLVGEDHLFALSRAPGPPLEGKFQVTVSFASEATSPVRKTANFRAFVDTYDYACASHPQKWLSESAPEDMNGWNPDCFFAGAPSGGGIARRRADSSGFPISTLTAEPVTALTEICAAIAARRSGFPESEIIELFGSVLEIANPVLTRFVLRSWVEAGVLDETVSISWRARRYFARQPRLVLRSEGNLRARLVGLAPTVLLKRLRSAVDAVGGTTAQCASASRWVAGPWEIRGLQAEQLNVLAHELGLGELLWVPAPETLVPAVDKIKTLLEEEPLNYAPIAEWSWERRRFVSVSLAEPAAVRVEHCSRSGRLDRPDYYVVRNNGSPVFVSYSRNWTLLFAARLHGVCPYRLTSGGVLISDGYPWVNLPLSVGRFCFAAGAGASGVTLDTTGERNLYTYIYPTGCEELVAVVLRTLRCARHDCQSFEARWLSKLATIRSQSEPLIALGGGFEPHRRVPVSLRALILSRSLHSPKK